MMVNDRVITSITAVKDSYGNDLILALINQGSSNELYIGEWKPNVEGKGKLEWSDEPLPLPKGMD